MISFDQEIIKKIFVSVVIFLGSLIILKIFKEIILVKLKGAAKKTKTEVDDIFIEIISDVKPPFYLFLSFYFGLKYLSLPGFWGNFLDSLFILAIGVQFGRALQVFINYGVKKITKQNKSNSNGQIKAIGIILKILLWSFIFLIILSNFGIDITALVAGMGVGGIAIAFAIQNVLNDIFSSFSIHFDKPFEEGDFIVIGDDWGVVKKIGIKTTRIQTLAGEELVVSNRELTETRIHNYKKMEKRRASFSFGVAYETPTKKLKKIPKIVKEIISDIDYVDFDRVHFKDFGDFSLNFEVVYYMLTNDYNKYMDVRQEINFNLKEKMEEESVEFAYPTYTLHIPGKKLN